MTTDTKSLTQPAAYKTSWLDKIKPHLELIAALFSGVLILVGWLLSRNGLDSPSIFVYIAAFLIGGYAKAKEGIEDTIADKELRLVLPLLAIGRKVPS